jgi:hypothetical protein
MLVFFDLLVAIPGTWQSSFSCPWPLRVWSSQGVFSGLISGPLPLRYPLQTRQKRTDLRRHVHRRAAIVGARRKPGFGTHQHDAPEVRQLRLCTPKVSRRNQKHLLDRAMEQNHPEGSTATAVPKCCWIFESFRFPGAAAPRPPPAPPPSPRDAGCCRTTCPPRSRGGQLPLEEQSKIFPKFIQRKPQRKYMTIDCNAEPLP